MNAEIGRFTLADLLGTEGDLMRRSHQAYARMVQKWHPMIYNDFQFLPECGHYKKRTYTDSPTGTAAKESYCKLKPLQWPHSGLTQSDSAGQDPSNPAEQKLKLTGAYIYCSLMCELYYCKVRHLPAHVQEWCNNKETKNQSLRHLDRCRPFSWKAHQDHQELEYFLCVKCQKGKSFITINLAFRHLYF